MAKPRKMLGAANAPYIVSLITLMDTQSKTTICHWSIEYAQQHILPIYEKTYPADLRPRMALQAAKEWLAGTIQFPAAKRKILDAHAAAKEAEDHPAAQAAARAAGQAASAIHVPTHALGVAFYGAAAVAYDRIGIHGTSEQYENIAASECANYELALKNVSIENEPHPIQVKWHCKKNGGL